MNIFIFMIESKVKINNTIYLSLAYTIGIILKCIIKTCCKGIQTTVNHFFDIKF